MWFKVAFAMAFVFAVTVAASTARRASQVHGASLNQLAHEVRGLLIVRAILGLVFYATLAAWLFWPATLHWTYLPISAPVRWCAVVLLVPCLAFLAWSYRTLGTNYRGGVGLYDDHALMTAGPYRLVRHPIYAAFVAVMLLVMLLSSNWLLGASGLLLVVSIAAGRIRIEEAQLHERFGRQWESYRDQTGCLIPRVMK